MQDHPQPVRALSASQYIRLSRGFSCIFWGIPLSLLLFSGSLQIYIVNQVKLPAYIIGSLVVYTGLLYLYRAGDVTGRWRALVGRALLAIFLQMYLAPFFFWWSRMPAEPYYLVNVLGLLACTVWVLVMLNLLAGEIAAMVGDRAFLMETRICNAAVLILAASPLCYAAYFSVRASAALQSSSLWTEVLYTSHAWPRWIVIPIVLPFTLTMASGWRAKEACLKRLAGFG